MSVLITSAAAFAAEWHQFQFRDELNVPFILHPLRVGAAAAKLGMREEFIAACYLHDVIEDTKASVATMHMMFPSYTMTLVSAMTKWWYPGDPRETVFQQIYYQVLKDIPGGAGALLKVLDRIDNMRDFITMSELSPKHMQRAARYAVKTERDVTPLLAHTPFNVREEFRNALERLKQVTTPVQTESES